MLGPYLARVECGAGEVLKIGGSARRMVYFPETMVACLHDPDNEAGIGMVGREGLLGWSALFDPAACYHGGRVTLSGGTSQVIAADRMRAAAGVSPTLTLALLRFVETFMIQMTRTILSNQHDHLMARTSRWLLMIHDRVDGDDIAITHGTLAALLDVRRASITDALHMLEGELALRCTRGMIIVRDRARLEQLAGSAYGASENAYRSIIGPFGKSGASSGPGKAALAASAQLRVMAY